MSKLVFPARSYAALADVLLQSHDETCAVLIVDRHHDRLIVTDTFSAPRTAYRQRDAQSAILEPEFFVPIVAAARKRGSGVAFVHTHPHDQFAPVFSFVDDRGEEELAEFLSRRIPNQTHLAMVISPGGCAAREMGTDIPINVEEVGAQIREITSIEPEGRDDDAWHRQIMAFGRKGQTRLRRLKVAVVGCGGTGSVAALELAHLGVGEFLLVDPDSVELSNLNRLVGAGINDVGRPKVAVTADEISRIGLGSVVLAIQDDVRRASSIEALTQCDAIISCTDSHSSRAVINQVAYQYVIPAFDVGVAIGVEDDGTIKHVAGRAQMLAPGLACLLCGNVLDASAIRRELLDDEGRNRDPYFSGIGVPEPAVISINSTMASLLVTMFLGAFTNAPLRARLQFYDGLSGRVRAATQRPDPLCIVCSSSGSLAKGERWPMSGLIE